MEKENKTKDWDNKFRTIEGWFHDDEDKDDLMYLRKHYIEDGDNSGGFWSSDRNPFNMRLQNASVGKDGQYNYDLRKKEVDKIYEEFLNQELKPNWWKQPWRYYYNDTLIKELDECVIIVGSEDNSIPYEIWNIINNKLNGRNYHLG